MSRVTLSTKQHGPRGQAACDQCDSETEPGVVSLPGCLGVSPERGEEVRKQGGKEGRKEGGREGGREGDPCLLSIPFRLTPL